MTLTEILIQGSLMFGQIIIQLFVMSGIVALLIACIKKIWDIIKK